MSKKDFIALADMIRTYNAYNANKPFDRDHLAALAIFCQKQNSNFKMQRWLDYIAGECGPNGGAIKKAA
jgi:hypothetical protein